MAPLETLARRSETAADAGRDVDAAEGRAILASNYTDFLLGVARGKGLDPATLFGDEPVFATRGRHARWSHEDLGVVGRNLGRATGDEFWGLVPDARIPLGTFRYACDLFPLCNTLGEALARAFRLYDLIGGARFELQVEGDLASIIFTPPSMPPESAAFLMEWQLWLWRFVAQWFVRSGINLVGADFTHAPRVDARLYDGTFGSRCRFGAPSSRILFPAHDLARAVARSPEEVDELFARTAISLNYSPNVEQSVSTALRVALLGRLQTQKTMPTLEDLAHEQGVTGQTLRRRLASEGVTYRALKAEVRSLVARRHLARPDTTLSEVASRAGFAETSAFTRAFRSWTGMSVSQFRRQAPLPT